MTHDVTKLIVLNIFIYKEISSIIEKGVSEDKIIIMAYKY